MNDFARAQDLAQDSAQHARGEGLEGGQAEAFAHATTPPVVGRVVEHHAGTSEEIHQVVDPALLELHPQPPIP